MKDYYKRITTLEIYELLDKIVAITDEASFNAMLKELLASRKRRGFLFNDRRRSILPHRKAWRQMMRETKTLAKRGE